MVPGWMESPGSASWGTTTMEAAVNFESCCAALRRSYGFAFGVGF